MCVTVQQDHISRGGAAVGGGDLHREDHRRPLTKVDHRGQTEEPGSGRDPGSRRHHRLRHCGRNAREEIAVALIGCGNIVRACGQRRSGVDNYAAAQCTCPQRSGALLKDHRTARSAAELRAHRGREGHGLTRGRGILARTQHRGRSLMRCSGQVSVSVYGRPPVR